MANGTAAKTPAANPGGGGLLKTIKDSRFGRFIVESYVETFHKSSWPTKQELTAFTVVVLIALGAVAAYIALLDGVLSRITEPLMR